jgi:hypothetical protein
VRCARKLLRLPTNRRFRSRLRHGIAATIEHAGALAGPGSAPRCSSSTSRASSSPPLEGCASLLDRFAAAHVECSFVPLYAGQPLADECLEHLCGQGFRLAGIDNLAQDDQGARCRRISGASAAERPRGERRLGIFSRRISQPRNAV